MNVERDSHERIRDDLAAFALGALAPREARELEAHLEGCESCRARLRWLAPAVDVLPASVPQRTPPPGLRESLLATVRAEAADAAGERAPVRVSPPQSAAASSPWWRSLGVALRPAAGFAAVLLVAAGLVGGYALRGEDGETPASTSVAAEPLAPRGETVSATLERHGDSATLHVHELPPLGRHQVYEVWVQRAGVMEPSSLFVLREDGSAEAAVPGPLEGGEAIFVTREPAGGSQEPTTEPVLTAPL